MQEMRARGQTEGPPEQLMNARLLDPQVWV